MANDEMKNVFRTLFCEPFDKQDPNALPTIKKKAVDGNFGHASDNCNRLRSIAWKLFLGILPADKPSNEWGTIITEKRKEYQQLLEKYEIDPHQSELDPTINNPLSQDEKSPWMQFFQNNELQQFINQDIERTYPELEFFKQTWVQRGLLRILFIYSKQYPKLGYKQGMHELLAPLFYLLEREKITPESPDDLLGTIMDANYMEHDAFLMLSAILVHMGDLFLTPAEKQKREEFSPFASNTDDGSNPAVVKCKYIQNVILKEKDPELYLHLTKLNVEPQLYMLRWIRLLGGREFHLDDLLVVWDGIFAYDSELGLMDYVCIAFLLFVRGDLMQQEYTGCMRRLFKFPPVEDPHIFVERAVIIHQTNGKVVQVNGSPVAQVNNNQHHNNHHHLHKAQRPVSMQFSPNQTSHLKQDQVQHQHSDQSFHIPKKVVQVSHMATNVVKQLGKELMMSEEPNPLEEEINYLRQTQIHMANRLERLVFSLQSEVLPQTTGSVNESVILVTAELKQVKDILSGSLSLRANGAPTPKLTLEDSRSKAPIIRKSVVPEKTEPAEPQENMDPLGVAVVTPKK